MFHADGGRQTDGRTVAFRNNVKPPKNSTLYPAIISPLFFCVVGESSKDLCAIYMASLHGQTVESLRLFKLQLQASHAAYEIYIFLIENRKCVSETRILALPSK